MYTSRLISFQFLQRFFQKTFTLLAAISLLNTQQLLAQVADDFSDGNFTNAPAWTGTDTKFAVISNQLKLQAPALAGNAYLSTPSKAISIASWEFFLRLDFNPSSTNFARVYLTSDQADLTTSLNGYFVMAGGSTDEISLYKQSGITKVKIIDGLDSRINLNTVMVKIKVTRDMYGSWELFSDVGSTGSYASEGVIFDNSLTSSDFFGVYCEYTSTRSDKFYFDNFLVNGTAFTDTTPPQWKTIEALNATKLRLTFSETLDGSSAETLNNYVLDSIAPAIANLLPDGNTVELTFSDPFINGVESTLQVSGIKDTSSNIMDPAAKNFLYFSPSPTYFKDLIITELFPDFSPSVGLPESEFTEIYNRSSNPVDLAGWKITDGTTTGTLPSKILLPGSYIILCSGSSAATYATLGPTLGITGFPTLNNASDKITLTDANAQVIDSVRYYSSWYRNEDKNDGGWTLELINRDDFCKNEGNWQASNNPSGGTPGTVNSVDSNVPDEEGPHLEKAESISSAEIILTFNERLNQQLPLPSDFEFFPSESVQAVSFSASDFKTIRLTLNEDLEEGRMYKITASNVKDCPGNQILPGFSQVYLNFDDIPPGIDSIKLISELVVDIFFSEKVLESALVNLSNFEVIGSQNPVDIIPGPDVKHARLFFASAFENGVDQKLRLSNISDINGNTLSDTVDFRFFRQFPYHFKDVIITEIFPDYTPTIGMPEGEFIEIHNRSDIPIDLENWTITDGSQTGKLPYKILLPNVFLILTHKTFHSQYSIFGETAGLSNFPSLNNSGDKIILKDDQGIVIDSLDYSNSWYKDQDKKDGGWTLELIDPDDLCKGHENWTASLNEKGGTPGHVNSVLKDISDLQGPKVQEVRQNSAIEMEIFFDEALDPNFPSLSSFSIQPELEIIAGSFKPGHRSILLSLSQEIRQGRTYKVSVKDVFDCPGNPIDISFSSGYLHYDDTPPKVDSIKVKSSKEIVLYFSENLEETSATNRTNYLWNGLNPETVLVIPGNAVLLTFGVSFQNGVPQILTIKNVNDINNNSLTGTVGFLFFEQHPYFKKDIIITELFPDPAPVIGLPEGEFVEIYNRSENPIDVTDWLITDGSTRAKFPKSIMLPGQYYIISSGSLSSRFSSFGNTISVGTLPSLNNSGDHIVITDYKGMMIDSVSYSDRWYRDETSREGGVSLELIDLNNICAEGSNWIASMDEKGGTPGGQNSVNANKPDVSGPKLVSVTANSDTTLLIQFDEKLQKTVPPTLSFSVKPDIMISSVAFSDLSLTSFTLSMAAPLIPGTLYSLTASAIFDCSGNEISPDDNTAAFALPEKPVENDILINEVLFNPRTGGVDFVEIYNNSVKFINLKGFSLANMDTVFRNIRTISATDLLLYPQQYLVVTTDKTILANEYPKGRQETFIEIHSLPSMTDDEGNVVLLDDQKEPIDSFFYMDDMHSVFIQDDEGVSLERISFSEPSESADNWRSASAQSGYATPGYQNSNTVSAPIQSEKTIRVIPEIFEPRNGQQDFTQIHYQFENGGLIVNIRIYDSYGRVIKEIAQNELIGTSGFFRWDGDEDSGARARSGYYLVWVETFDANGKTQTFMRPVAIASRF